MAEDGDRLAERLAKLEGLLEGVPMCAHVNHKYFCSDRQGKGRVMAADMQQWATREQVDALTAAQAQDRKELHELAKGSAKLEGQVGEMDKRLSESDKSLATKADVEQAMGLVRVDIEKLRSDNRLLRWGIGIAILSQWGDFNIPALLQFLGRLPTR